MRSERDNGRGEDLGEDDDRRHCPRFQGDNCQKNLDLVARITDIAHDKGCTASQFALAWGMAQGDNVVPIPGTRRRKYLDENVAANAVTLDAAGLRRGTALPGRHDGRHRPPRDSQGVEGHGPLLSVED